MDGGGRSNTYSCFLLHLHTAGQLQSLECNHHLHRQRRSGDREFLKSSGDQSGPREHVMFIIVAWAWDSEKTTYNNAATAD